MFQNLCAALVPALTLFLEPPVLPAPSTIASVGLRVESEAVTLENFAETMRWVVLTSGSVQVTYALAPHSNVVWTCTEECLWDVDLKIADTDSGVLQFSPSVSLYAALDCDGQTLWFGQSQDCWLETEGWLDTYYDCSGEVPSELLHVPVVRPDSQPDGSLPPVIDPKPLPPV